MTGSRHWLVFFYNFVSCGIVDDLYFLSNCSQFDYRREIAGISILFQKTHFVIHRNTPCILLAIVFFHSLFSSKFAIAHKGRGKNDLHLNSHNLFTAALSNRYVFWL